MNVNFFLCYTEYHLMLAIAVAKLKMTHCSNNIYISPNSRISDQVIEHAQTLNDEHFQIRVFDSKNLIPKLLGAEKKVERFFIFQEGGLDNLYLMDQFRKRGATIALCQDGAKPYALWKKEKLWLVVLRDTLQLYKDSFQRKMFLSRFTLVNQYKYPYSPFVDELWLSHPEAYLNKKAYSLMEIPEFSMELIPQFDKLFGMNEDIFSAKNGAVFYIDQCFTDATNYNRNIEIVQTLRSKFPDKPMYIKLHSNSSKEQTDKYKAIQNTHIIYEKIPAELFIARLRDSIIIGGHSTAMLYYQESNRYYYISKLFIRDRLFSQMEPGNPTHHIQEVSNIDEIV